MIAEFLELVEEEHGGMRRHMYKDALAAGQRVGQAFMNALRGTPYYNVLSGSPHDVFYTDDMKLVYLAIDFLTTS